MDKKKLVVGVLGVSGLAALAYYLYQRSQGAPVVVSNGVSYNANTGQQVSANAFPNKATVLRIVQQYWPQYFADLNATYNAQTGMASGGDWKIKVVSNNPLIIQFNKGATESFKLREGSASAYDQLRGLGNISVII